MAADIERAVERLKNLKYPTMERGEKTMNGEFRRVGITVSANKVTVSLEGGHFSYRGQSNTIESAIGASLKKLNDKMDAHMG